jgi:DNA-binding MarR family transcriptional regulator
MHVKKGKDLTLLCNELLQFWLDVKAGITISELRVINKIFYYYDNHIDCGHKELVADLNIPSSALSKLLKNWMLDNGTIITKKSKTDKRRNFYYPSKDYVDLREDFLYKMKIKIK